MVFRSQKPRFSAQNMKTRFIRLSDNRFRTNPLPAPAIIPTRGALLANIFCVPDSCLASDISLKATDGRTDGVAGVRSPPPRSLRPFRPN